jgi:hypothetical protein
MKLITLRNKGEGGWGDGRKEEITQLRRIGVFSYRVD